MDLLLTVLLNFLDTLSSLDRKLFIFIHSTASSENIDWLFRLLRTATTWIPLYAFVLFWIIWKQRPHAWQFILMTLITFAITDHISAAIMKPYFERLRPCFDPALDQYVRELVSCGGKYGMPSTHASNHFGLASFWFFSISWLFRHKWYWLWVWALLIGYAQVYVGKHYPGDILVGALFGTSVGVLMALLFRYWRTARQDHSLGTTNSVKI